MIIILRANANFNSAHDNIHRTVSWFHAI